MTQDRLEAVQQTTFAAAQVRERDDLQRLLRDQIDVVAPGVLLIGEEFEDFVGARRRIDLLGVDSQGRIVVIELKRTEDAGHGELPAIRYAAMVSAMTFDQVAEQRERFAADRGLVEPDSRAVVRQWVGGGEALGDDVRLVLVAPNFGIELTTSVLWLSRRHDLDITCVRVVPYSLEGRLLLDVQQVIPLPETADYQVSVRRKETETRQAAAVTNRDFTRYELIVNGSVQPSSSKQGTVKQAVAFLNGHGVPLPAIREAIGKRWKHVEAPSAEAISAPGFGPAHGMPSGWWLDALYADEAQEGWWWIMARFGGPDTENLLDRLCALAPDMLAWQRAQSPDQPSPEPPPT